MKQPFMPLKVFALAMIFTLSATANASPPPNKSAPIALVTDTSPALITADLAVVEEFALPNSTQTALIGTATKEVGLADAMAFDISPQGAALVDNPAFHEEGVVALVTSPGFKNQEVEMPYDLATLAAGLSANSTRAVTTPTSRANVKLHTAIQDVSFEITGSPPLLC